MEESKEIHSGERKASSEKNQKRRLKTPDQVKALEKFYNENKYPTEEMKSEIAEQLGLTEKQVSGWFCHRRLKDKRVKQEALANGRQDHSSGIIQDLGSGHRQDSCGSTKQGDHWPVEPREVESRSFHHHNAPAAFISDEPRGNYAGNVGDMDDASSGSSSHSQERLYSAGTSLKNVNVPKYLTHNGINATSDARNIFSMGGYKPSGYLKVKCDSENAAITAVRRQLGRLYREDGPPLGIEFDPLPPGAFEFPIRDESPGSYYGGDRTYSPDTDRLWRPTSVTTRDSLYDQRISSKISPKEGANFSRTNSHDFEDYQSIPNLREKHSLFRQPVQFSSLDPSSDMLEDSGDHVSAYSRKRNYRLNSRDKEEMGTSVYNQYDGGSNSDKRGLRSFNPGNIQVGPTSRSASLKKKGQVREEKDEKQYYDKKAASDYYDLVKVKKHPTREIPMAKRVRKEFPLQDYAGEASMYR
ncbi:hypothetical protein CDL15_Pgr026627 [Punica granatum]|uniref:Homeobox domain-containing protein n=1 Tax=Punica granatum TaxID=22663 RepID=A0A218WM19_PUNGR|nr:hypothetical protein CDL15_Pgr026627 [Punica granatum]